MSISSYLYGMYYVIYGLLYVLSLLPFTFLYLISDFFYIVLYHLIRYRRKVVTDNLTIAFPEKTAKERTFIARQFYKNLLDNFVETIKMLSLSRKEFLKHCDGNFEALHNIIRKGKTIQFHGAHLFNWEYGNWLLPLKMQLPVAVVFIPIKNKVLNAIFLKIRSRFGAVMVDATQYSKEIKKVARQQHVLALVADQNPGVPAKSYWLKFFNRPAPFMIGPEKGASRSKNAVVFTRYVRVKRGHYYFENQIITDDASECKPGELTKKFRDFIQAAITREPAGFLWSHRRWKHMYQHQFEKLWVDDEKPLN